jgi:NADPH2:quinone reductase
MLRKEAYIHEMKAIRVHAPGGPEALRLEDVPQPVPGPGQVLVKIEAAGVNFIDVYQRSGQYRIATPFTIGQEAAGVVVAVDSSVSDVKPGTRVAYTGIQGAYAEFAAVPADRVVQLSDGLDTKQGAAAMLQGMTAHYLASSTYPLKPGDTCVVHAAAGGVGLLLCQVAKRRGARVIGTVSTAAKAALAREAGADEVIRYTEQDFETEVKRLTGGAGVQVVYDSVGKTTFEKGLNVLAPRGVMVLYGQSSGPVAAIDPQRLSQKGSLYLTRPTLQHYITTRAELLARAGEVLQWIGAGALRLRIGLELPLAQAAEAHRRLEGRQTTGKVLLSC